MNATKKRKITKKGYLLLGAILICILISLTAFLITQQKKKFCGFSAGSYHSLHAGKNNQR